MLQVLISCGFKGNFARKLPVRRGVGGGGYGGAAARGHFQNGDWFWGVIFR